MNNKKISALILNILVLTFCSSQEKNSVYLDFKSNNSGTCSVSAYRDGRNKKKFPFKFEKETIKINKIRFKICNQFFLFDPENQTKKIVSKNDLDIVNIDYLFNKLEEEPFNKNKKTVVEKIYILEKISKNKYMSYEVLWKDYHIERRFKKQQ